MDGKAFSNLQPFVIHDVSTDSVRESYAKWKRNFGFCVTAAKVTDSTEKRDLFLALSGVEMQDVVHNIPGALVTKTNEIDPYETLIKKLDEYFAPQRHSILERHLFWKLKQSADETDDKFLLRLTSEASKCNFGKNESESREIAVMDKFLSCVSSNVKERLLQESDLNLMEMTRKVKAYQASKAAVEAMGSQGQRQFPSTSTNINAMRYRTRRRCSRCGRDEHKQNESCPAEGMNCSKCGLRNHFAVCCRTRPENFSKYGRKRSQNVALGASRSEGLPYKRSKIFSIDDEEVDQNVDDQEGPTNYIRFLGEGDEMMLVSIGNVMIEMLVDSGSKYNIIDGSTYEYLKMNNDKFEKRLKQADRVFSGYAQKQRLHVKGKFSAKIVISDKGRELTTIADFYVIPQGHQPLLGRDTAQTLGVLVIGMPSERINNVELQDESNFSVFPHVKGVKLCIPIRSGVRPVSQPVRRVPVAIQGRVEQMLIKLEQMDIIEEVIQPSEWCSALVVVPKDDGEVRLCVDLRMVNKAVMRQQHPLPTLEDYRAAMSGATVYSKLDFRMFYHQIMLHEDSRS